MASKKRGTLYIGVTSNLEKRVYQHTSEHYTGFTKRYGLKRLVYVAYANRMRDAIELEKRLKKWKREWKIRLIESENPNWVDLAAE